MISKDKSNQITLTPYFFAVSLKGKYRKKITNELLVKLGEANLFGWLAYTIYDDFFDCEGRPELLSIANISLRELTAIYVKLGANQEFMQLFTQIMDRVDLANDREIVNCHFEQNDAEIELSTILGGKPQNSLELSEKSLGHAICLVYLLQFIGFAIDSQEIKSLILYVQNSLSARQLSDDIHDWEDDLNSGILTKVARDVLNDYVKDGGSNSLSLKENIIAIQKVFWFNTVDRECKDILAHIKEAEKALDELVSVDDKSLLSRQIEGIVRAARETLNERNEVIDFLDSYSNN